MKQTKNVSQNYSVSDTVLHNKILFTSHNYPITYVLCSFEDQKDKNPTVKWQDEEEKDEGKEKRKR